MRTAERGKEEKDREKTVSQWLEAPELRGPVEEEEPQEILREGAVRSQETWNVVLRKPRDERFREEVPVHVECCQGVESNEDRDVAIGFGKVKVDFFADMITVEW